ncbi:MAG: TolC family protein [Acidobacteria bacterium]|nr:TolC family protein [Acidobacteriota bacterium]
MNGVIFGALALSAMALVQPSTLDFESILARARTDPHALRAEAERATRSRSLANTGGLLREGPTFIAEAGSRTGPTPRSTDRSAQMEFPLLLAPGLRHEAGLRFQKSSNLMAGVAQAEARHRLRQAYLDAWLAQRELQLRRSQVDLTRSWLEVARARSANGSDPAFQPELVRGDLFRLEGELAEGARRASESWGALRTLAEIPETPAPLADPGAPRFPDPQGLAQAFECGLLNRALQEQLASDRAGLDLQHALRASRWSLRGSYASEGEERIARVGVSVRLPRPGESAALGLEARVHRSALEREAETARMLVRVRFQSALERLPLHLDIAPGADFAGALRAVDLRLREGKDRPSESLALRRQLLEAENSRLRRHHDAHTLLNEIELLTLGESR